MSTPDMGQIAGLLGQLLGGGNARGLASLTDHLRQNGLGQEVDSWIGPGANRPVDPNRLAQALGPQLGAMGGGQAAGGGLAGALAALLPVVVNALTPQGRLPQRDEELPQGGLAGLLGGMGGAPSQAAGAGGLAGMLGGLFGGGGPAAGQAGGSVAEGLTDGRAYGKFGPGGDGGQKA